MGETKLTRVLELVAYDVLEIIEEEGCLVGEELEEYIRLAIIDRKGSPEKKKKEIQDIKKFIENKKRYTDANVKRKCLNCGEYKVIKEFPTFKCRGSKYYHSYCKVCNNIRSKEWTKNNLERKKEMTAKWKKNNPEKIKKHKKIWIEKNKEHTKKYMANYYANKAIEKKLERELTGPEKKRVEKLVKEGMKPGKIFEKLWGGQCA